MNDRFKFRVWNKLSNIMTYNFMMGNFFQKSLDDYEKKDWIGLNYEPEYICFINEAIENLIIMQCTGLKDKNGILIYEGDIVRVHRNHLGEHFAGRDYVVKFYKYQYWLHNCGYHPLSDFTYRANQNLEVIGNIYENKELLNE